MEELLTVISIALASGMWQAGKKMLEATAESALKPAKEKLESGLLKKYRAGEKDEKLLGAIKSALQQAGAPEDDDKVTRWLKGTGLDRLQAENNSALRQALARAVIGFTDSNAQPPADLITALAWPRSRADELSKLLVAFRAAFAGLEGWKDLIAYADSAHQNGALNNILNALSKMENAFVQSEAGAYLRVALIEEKMSAEQAAQIEAQYRKGIENEFRLNRLSGLAQVQKVVALPLEEIYLELGLLPIANEKDREREAEEMLEMREERRMEMETRRMDERVGNALGEESKLVIVGKPGSGKTTSLKFIALMLAHGGAGAARLGLNAPYLPVFVRLADYAEKLKTNSSLALERFLLDYIDEAFPGAKGQPEFLRLALDKGACMILLDGLDEVGDFGDTLIHGHTLRAETLKKVQSFASRRCNADCANRVVVTSRLEGYQRGDLPEFREMEISPLQVPDEAEAFLLRWFTAWLQSVDSKLDYETAQRLAQRDYVNGAINSINQSESVRRLAMNPLLLTILAVIYETGKRLPNRRVELYEVVAKTMIQNWRHEQTGHENKIHLLMDANEVYFALTALAYWLHENKAGGTMPSAEWQIKIEGLLRDAGHADAELKQLTEHFLSHAQKETGLLAERSHGQIGFFHLTLEEYLAAVEIARQDTDARLAKLERHWQNPRWQEVILLAAGELDQRGNKQAFEGFLLHLLHLEGGEAGRNATLAGSALADAGIRKAKDSIQKDIREKLKLVMQDADPEARILLQTRAQAADILDELGYLPPDLYEFALITNPQLPITDFYLAKHPVTNLQYKRFLASPDFADKKYWTDFPKYDENGVLMNETWGDEGFEWLQDILKNAEDTDGKVVFPRFWTDPRFGIIRRTAPVVGVTWHEANAYCKWLSANWQTLPESQSNSSFIIQPSSFPFRLPTEREWLAAAGGLGEAIIIGKNKKDEEIKRYRFPWDKDGEVTPEPQADDDTIMQEILRRANIDKSGIGRTTLVSMYPLGRTQSDLWDMTGNVWEWQASYYDKDHDYLALKGSSWGYVRDAGRVSGRLNPHPLSGWDYNFGFRVLFARPSKPL